MLRPLAAVEIERSQAQLRLVVASAAEPPDVVNLGAVERAQADGVFQYRGILYRVPPISYLDGAALQQSGNTIGKLASKLEQSDNPADDDDSKAELARLLAAFESVLDIMWRLVQPVGWFRRIAWRIIWRGNPFAGATVSEVGELLGFFYTRRTTSTVRLGGWTVKRPPRPSS